MIGDTGYVRPTDLQVLGELTRCILGFKSTEIGPAILLNRKSHIRAPPGTKRDYGAGRRKEVGRSDVKVWPTPRSDEGWDLERK